LYSLFENPIVLWEKSGRDREGLRATTAQDNSVYYNIDRDQDRSSASDLAYGFSIDKPPSHGGLVRSRIRRFEVSRFRGFEVSRFSRS